MQLSEFIKPFQSVTIGSLDSEGFPFNSYAPFVQQDGKYYTLLSNLARHAKNLQENNQASLFFIEDEKSCENIFARKRANITCEVCIVSKEDAQTILPSFINKHGQMAQMLLQMGDFNFYAFTPLRGEAIFGFGAAYTLSHEDFDTLLPRGDVGHEK